MKSGRCGMMVTILIIIGLSVAGAGPAPFVDELLRKAEDLVTVELKFKKAIDVLNAALARREISRTQRVDAYKLLATAYVARDLPDAAEQAFDALLDLDPRFELDASVSPKILRVFERARARHPVPPPSNPATARKPRLADVRVAPKEDRAIFRARLVDPDALVMDLELLVRIEPDEGAGSPSRPSAHLERQTVVRSGEELTATIPTSAAPDGPLRLLYHLAARGADGSVVAEIGTDADPVAVTLERPARPAVTGAPTAPPLEVAKASEVAPDHEADAPPWYGHWWVWAVAAGVVGAGIGIGVALGSSRHAQTPGTLGAIHLP